MTERDLMFLCIGSAIGAGSMSGLWSVSRKMQARLIRLIIARHKLVCPWGIISDLECYVLTVLDGVPIR